jgi:hypothetical protein
MVIWIRVSNFSVLANTFSAFDDPFKKPPQVQPVESDEKQKKDKSGEKKKKSSKKSKDSKKKSDEKTKKSEN